MSRLFAIRAAIAAALLCLFAPTAGAQDAACTDSGWSELRPEFFQRTGCAGAAKVPFKAIAFSLSTYKLGLRSPKADGSLPTLDDVNAAEAAGTVADYSLERALKDGDIAVASVAYPEDERFFVASGLVRIGGTDLAERDTRVPFKSAMFCLNEAEFNQVGSRLIVFNAFEKNRPIQLNERLRASNCPEVVQVGPRIVEYRAKKGIAAGEARSGGQRYAVFAQGNGGAKSGTGFHGYLFMFEAPINLLDIQDFLLSADAGHIDTKMRIGVVVASDAYSGMIWRNAAGEAQKAGTTTRPHPVFLTVRPVE